MQFGHLDFARRTCISLARPFLLSAEPFDPNYLLCASTVPYRLGSSTEGCYSRPLPWYGSSSSKWICLVHPAVGLRTSPTADHHNAALLQRRPEKWNHNGITSYSSPCSRCANASVRIWGRFLRLKNALWRALLLPSPCLLTSSRHLPSPFAADAWGMQESRAGRRERR